MEFFIYLKTLTFFLILSICGIIIIRRLTEENRAQILVPSGAILGVALYIFLINLVAHFIKGVPGFYLSLGIEIFIAFLVRRLLITQPMEFPQRVLSIFSIICWAVFLYIILSTHQFGGDVINHYSLAALFSRGDYPIHTTWQPDYVMYYHIGGAQFLGATRSITGAPFEFTHRLLGLFMFISWSQILTWLLVKNIPYKLLSLPVISIPAFVGLVSLGGFILAWPVSLGPINFEGNLFQWFSQLPTLRTSQDSYGSPLTLDMIFYFLHRFLSLSIFFALLPILITPRKENYNLVITGIIIFLSSMALVDESVLIVTLPAILIISFFTICQKSIFKIIPLILLSALIISFQGGIITEALFNRSEDRGVLILPNDKEFRAYQIYQISSRLFDNLENYQPLSFYHPGIIWQLSLLLILCCLNLLRNKSNLTANLWLFFISATTSFVAYFALVPKLMGGNTNRFLALSYLFSGIGISLYLVRWWFSAKRQLLFLKFILIWILFFSLIPPLFYFFPRPKSPGMMPPLPSENLTYNWVRENLPINQRIMVLTLPTPALLANIGLALQVGALTPVWGPQPKVADNLFEVSPIYIDAFYTLNPEILQTLKVSYLVIGNNYLPQLAVERNEDLTNGHIFQPVFTNSLAGETILKINATYFQEGKIIGGTLKELEQIAPKKGTFYIEYVPNIPEYMFRSLRVLLHDRDVYHPIGAAFYNGSIDVKLTVHDTLIDSYDYLILAETTEPKTICDCEAKLLWTGRGNGLKLWKTN